MSQAEDAIKAFQNKLRTFPRAVQNEVSQEILASAQVIVRNAQSASPINKGTLRQLITYSQTSPLDVIISAGANYSAYVEFGTGSGPLTIPSGFEALAALSRGAGIRQRNKEGHPFLIPAYLAEKPLLIGRIKNILDEAGKNL